MSDMDIISLLQYEFIQRAVISGIFVAIACAALGVLLVLRKLSLIGDGLAHTSFGGVALGLFLGLTPMYAALPIAVLASLIILWLTKHARVYGDAAIGIVSASGIAAGTILASLAGGFNVDLFGYLFGNILAISRIETILTVIASLTVLMVMVALRQELFAMAFDETYAKTLGIRTARIDALFFILTSVVVVLAIQVVGVLLVSALLIIPAVSALQTGGGFRRVTWTAAGTALLTVLIGIIVSFIADIPTGATIVIINLAAFACAAGMKQIKRP
jgi:zinc transport system permease protein